jgi:hypothetical protein
MKPHPMLLLGAIAAACLPVVQTAQGQGAPDIVWEEPTPNTLANSIQGVGWAPSATGNIAFGSTDRWLRTRNATSGALLYSVLQPLHSDSVVQAFYSTDGAFLAAHNANDGLGFRVHRAADGVFLGKLTATVGSDGVVRFAADTNLLAAVGGDGTLSRWRVEDFRVSMTVGSGYDKTNTTFNFSPDGQLQSAASRGTITIRRRSDGQIVRVLNGLIPVTFTPDSTRVAAWTNKPNQVTLWRISDGAALMNFPSSATNEGVGTIRFTLDGAHLITTGYFPYIDSGGLWQQKGMIRFWRVSDGALRQVYDARTGIAVTSPIAWSPDGTRFAYGTYEGTAVVARTPATIQTSLALKSIEMLSDGNVRLRQPATPGATYHIETTTNSLLWQEIGTATANANGYFEFLDTNCHGCAVKLYRFHRSQ